MTSTSTPQQAADDDSKHWPEPVVPPADLRSYLTALRDLLDAEHRPAARLWALASLDSVLAAEGGGREVVWEYETSFLRARLGEISDSQPGPRSPQGRGR